MRFMGLGSEDLVIEDVELQHPVAGLRSVGVCRWTAPCPSVTTAIQSERQITLVLFKRERAFATILDELRSAVALEDGAVAVKDEEKGKLVGRLLWSHLHPDIGTGVSAGQSASLGKRKVYFHSFFSWLGDWTHRKDLWTFLAGDGRRRFPVDLPSFADWKKQLHFGDTALPTKEELAEAEGFLENEGIELATAECLHRQNDRWSAPRPDGRFPPEFYNWVRNDAGRLEKRHGLSPGAHRAATLLSYATAAEIHNQMANAVLSALPEGLLDDASRKVFALMWCVPSTRVDDRGRFDLPIMGSPLLSSALEYVLEFDEEGRAARDKEGIVSGLLHFALSGIRNRAVEIALGFGAYYRTWLVAERDGEREKAQKKRKTRQRYAEHVRAMAPQGPAKPASVPKTEGDSEDESAPEHQGGRTREAACGALALQSAAAASQRSRLWIAGERRGRPHTRVRGSGKKSKG